MATEKVLHLIDSAGMYGAENVVLTLLEELKESRFPGILGCIREHESQIPKIAVRAKELEIQLISGRVLSSFFEANNTYFFIFHYLDKNDLRISEREY